MEKEYKAHPFEFFHGEAIRQFHLYRSANNLEANFKIDGIIFNEIIVAAKNETKKKYPEEIELSSLGGEEKTLEEETIKEINYQNDIFRKTLINIQGHCSNKSVIDADIREDIWGMIESLWHE